MYRNLKILRKSMKMTQKDFAASLGIGYTTYNGYETGAREPKSDFWIAVAQKYNVTIDYLMGYTNSPHETKQPAPTNGDGLAEDDKRIIELLHQLTPENRERIVAIIKALASQ